MKANNEFDKIVEKVSVLTQIPLTPERASSLPGMFEETLDYIAVLDELDTSDVKPTFQVTGLKNVYQQYHLNEKLSQEEALSNAKKVVRGLFATKGVFEDAE